MNRKTFLLAIAFAAIKIQAHAQGGVPLWTNWYDAPGKVYEQANAIAVDADGNVIVTGYVQTTNGSDVDTIKYSNAGVPLWTNSFEGGSGWAITANNNGDVFVTGLSGSNNGVYFTSQYLTLAYSSAGVLLWTNVSQNGVSGPTANSATAVTVTSSSNVVVTGHVYGGQFHYSYATVAYSGTGMPLWTNGYNGGKPVQLDAYATAIAADTNGNVFVTGYAINGSVSTDNGFDYTTLKYSETGLPLWTNCYNGTGTGDNYARAIVVDRSGNVFVTGYSMNSNSNYDYATVAYSNAGLPLWTNLYNDAWNGNDYARAIAVDHNGNVFVTGYSTNNNNGYDYVTIAYSNAGLPLWTNRYDGPASGNDYAVAIGVDSNGNVFVTGYSANGEFINDYATVAYSNGGLPLWTNRYSGPTNSYDTATALAVDSRGNVFVTGYAEPESHGQDYTTIKYSSSLPPPVYLNFQFSGNQLLLTWTNSGFQLQSAPAVTGPFTNISDATSPYTNSIFSQQQYFRLNSN